MTEPRDPQPLSAVDRAAHLLNGMLALQRRYGRLGKVPVFEVAQLLARLDADRSTDGLREALLLDLLETAYLEWQARPSDDYRVFTEFAAEYLHQHLRAALASPDPAPPDADLRALAAEVAQSWTPDGEDVRRVNTPEGTVYVIGPVRAAERPTS